MLVEPRYRRFLSGFTRLEDGHASFTIFGSTSFFAGIFHGSIVLATLSLFHTYPD